MQQLRIATIGDFQRFPSHYLMGTVQGSILNGHLHISIPIRQFHREIENQLNSYKPHILFTHMLFSENLKDMAGVPISREGLHETIVKIKSRWGTKTIMQEGDGRNDPRYPYPIDSLIDLCLVNSKRHTHFSNILKVPCTHWPYFTLNQEEISSVNNAYNYNCIYAGNVSVRAPGHIHYGRAEFISKVSERLDIKLFPDGVMGNTTFSTAEVASSCKAVLGIHQGNNVEGYLDVRPFQYCGSGGLYFHSECSAINQFFRPEYHFVQYEHMNVDSFMDKYNYYMEHPLLCNKIRQQAFEYTQKHHTSKHRIKMVLDILDGKEPEKIYIEDLC